jgi:oligoribonuclease NrnB/cAMP/cGMP phosphodiesterase (DHH superfamily)
MARVCFYHAGCPDGFGAAWAVWRAWGDDARYVARGHEDPLPAHEHEGDLVVFVDIAPPNEPLRSLGEVASQVIILDHHISSRERLRSDLTLVNALDDAGHRVVFDLGHSGAVLAWRAFHAQSEPPALLAYVEDQDLWNWKLPRSREVNAAIGSYPRRFDVWDELAERPWEELAAEGDPIVRAERLEVERALQGAHPLHIDGRRMEAVNSRYVRSQIGHSLAGRAAFGEPVGCVYRLAGSRVDASLYSIGEFDVSRIAAGFGGGGHRNAAGFSVPLARWIADFL